MRWTKNNNPSKRRKHYGKKHSSEYAQEMRDNYLTQLMKCENSQQEQLVTKAYNINE